MTNEVFSLSKMLSSLTFNDIKIFVVIILIMYGLVSTRRFFDRLNDVSDIEENERDKTE